MASETQIEKNKARDQRLKSGLKTAASAAATVAGVGLGSRIMPFLNDFIPVDLAIKGISKVAPEVGSFLKKGMKTGLDVKEGLSFIKNSLSGESKSAANQHQGIIEQYSPDLMRFLKDEIANGMPPQKAGAVARLMNKDFEKAIKQIEKDHKTDFSLLLQNIFGSAEQPQAQQEQSQMQGQQQQGQAPGGIDPALMSIMQNMQSTMNKFRGR